LPPNSHDGVAESTALKQAVTTYGNAHYDGPQPLHGTHHDRFRLLALKVPALGVKPPPTVDALKTAAAPAVIAEAQLIGTFRKTLFGNYETNEDAGRRARAVVPPRSR